MDSGTLANVASVIGAFGAAMLFFRIQRELQMRKAGERVWLPLADWLIFAATLFLPALKDNRCGKPGQEACMQFLPKIYLHQEF